jgi:hypothetical protein
MIEILTPAQVDRARRTRTVSVQEAAHQLREALDLWRSAPEWYGRQRSSPGLQSVGPQSLALRLSG